MEPLSTAAIAIGSVVATRALEKTGEKIGEALWDKTDKFLVTLKKHSPHTITAIEKAPEEPLDYGKASLEVENAAQSNPELAQAVQELVAAASSESNAEFIKILQQIAETLKSVNQKVFL
ncbi:MAG: hypothetical protein MJK14_18205 [Rivularia sp. ALOHA_DT_140]|nr:hypothetical protein [Rivularia sp. ALOHA_DT_140]